MRADIAGSGRRGSRTVRRAFVSLALLGALSPVARADALSLHELLASADKALSILMAEADYTSAEAEWNRARAEKGWKIDVTAGYGKSRDIIDETRTRTFDAIQSKVGLSYPLLGAYARQEREIEIASGALQQKRIRRDAALRIAQLEIEDVYAAYWGAQEGLEVIAAYLGRDADDGDAARKASSERRRLKRRLEEARRRLEQLVGSKLPGLVAVGVQLPAMAELNTNKLLTDHPELAALRAEHASTRKQLDDSVWWGVNASFDLTQTATTEYERGQAGNDLFAHFNISMPLQFYEAGTQERRRLRADMEILELKLKGKGEEIVGKAQDAHAEHRELYEDLQGLTRRTQSLGQSLRRDGADDRRRADYFLLALDEVQARTRYWRSHVELRSYLVVGEAEPAPEPTGPTTTDLGTRLAEPLRN